MSRQFLKDRLAYDRALAAKQSQQATMPPPRSPAAGTHGQGVASQPPAAGTHVAGTATNRPAGSSNDPTPQLSQLGTPYVNPMIDAYPVPVVAYPIFDPSTGIRPAVRVVSVDVPVSTHLAAAMQTCSTCDASSATSWCPMYRRLGSQGKNHQGVSPVTSTCCMQGCEVPLCGPHLYPNDKGIS